jgi:hypothetical protein
MNAGRARVASGGVREADEANREDNANYRNEGAMR